MAERAFVDSGLLVCAADGGEPEKRARARALLGQRDRYRFVLSTQVLEECYLALISALARPMSEAQAEAAVRALARWPLVQVDAALVLSAMSLARQHRVLFRDALIVQAAVQGGCKKLFTEDLKNWRRIGPLAIENPFAP